MRGKDITRQCLVGNKDNRINLYYTAVGLVLMAGAVLLFYFPPKGRELSEMALGAILLAGLLFMVSPRTAVRLIKEKAKEL